MSTEIPTPVDENPAPTHYLVYYTRKYGKSGQPLAIALVDSLDKVAVKRQEVNDYEEKAYGGDHQPIEVLELTLDFDYLQRGKQGPLFIE